MSLPTPDRPTPEDDTLPATDIATLWSMEEHFWTSGAHTARAGTNPDAVMIVPFPPGILQNGNVGNTPAPNTGWRTVILADRHVARRGDVAVLTYLASAEKPEVPIYKAFCSSTFLHDDGRWLRTSHKQTDLN